MTSLQDLPNEILYEILSHTGVQGLRNFIESGGSININPEVINMLWYKYVLELLPNTLGKYNTEIDYSDYYNKLSNFIEAYHDMSNILKNLYDKQKEYIEKYNEDEDEGNDWDVTDEDFDKWGVKYIPEDTYEYDLISAFKDHIMTFYNNYELLGLYPYMVYEKIRELSDLELLYVFEMVGNGSNFNLNNENLLFFASTLNQVYFLIESGCNFNIRAKNILYKGKEGTPAEYFKSRFDNGDDVSFLEMFDYLSAL